MVFDDGTVENRLMRLPAGRHALGAAARRPTSSTPACAAAPWSRPRPTCAAELDQARAASWTPPPRGWWRTGLAAWSGGEAEDRALIVRGRANLLDDAGAVDDLERVRMLFDDLEQKEQLIGLLDGVREARACAFSSARKRGCSRFRVPP